MIHSWHFLIGLSIIFYTLSTLINKVVVKNRPGEFASLSIQIMVSIMMLPFIGQLPHGLNLWILTLAAGFCYGLGSIMYFDAISIEEVSLISPLFNFQPVFVLLVAVPFLGESIGLQKILGILLVVFGASFLKKSHNIISSLKLLFENRSVVLAMLATFFFSIARVIDKVVLPHFDTITYGFLQWFLPGMIVMTYVVGKHEISEFTGFFREKMKLIFLNAIVGALAYVTFLGAVRLQEISILAPLVNLNTFFVVLLSHRFLGERLNGRPVAAALMVIGAALVLFI